MVGSGSHSAAAGAPGSRIRGVGLGPPLGNGVVASTETDNSFACYSCGRRYRWRAEIAGKSLRCHCGVKVRCPEPRDDTVTAGQSLDDTVTDVELEEHFDHIDPESAAAAAEREEQAVEFRRLPQKGMFGWPMGREVLFWGVLSLIGLALSILAAITREHFIPYSIAAVLVGPYSWWRLWKAWPRWTQGRPWTDCLAQALGMEAEDEDKEAA